jgi:hypothetical protein
MMLASSGGGGGGGVFCSQEMLILLEKLLKYSSEKYMKPDANNVKNYCLKERFIES